jgi:hypothetical protein
MTYSFLTIIRKPIGIEIVIVEVHHAKSFNDICVENNITTIKQALTCKEIWSLDNGISLCYGCHKNIEKPKAKIKNIFV